MWLSHFKDQALARTARVYLNHKFKSLGRMTTLRLDTASHTIEITADLAGESQPIDARIAYRLEERDGQLHFVPTKVECSRPWLEILATQMLADDALHLPVPAGMATAIVKMLRV